MAAKLKVGIAGYGVVGKRRRHYIDLHPQLETVAVSDVNLEKGALADGVRTYPNYEDLLVEDLDILFVCLPNYLAPDATIKGLKRNMHVFCEKPPGRDVDDIANVIRVAQSYPQLKLKYGFNHRYHDSVQDALKLVESGELGKVINLRGVYGKSKIINFESEWRTQRKIAGGGILLDQGIHMLDMMRLFCGEFVEINSFISNEHWKHDVEDNAYALMKTKNSIVAMMHSSATQWRHRFNLEIALEKGTIVLSGILSGSKSYGAETITVAYKADNDAGDPVEKTTRYNQDNSWKLEIDEFAECVLENKAIRYGTAHDAFKTMELVYRIYCADQSWANRYNLSSDVSPALFSKDSDRRLDSRINQEL